MGIKGEKPLAQVKAGWFLIQMVKNSCQSQPMIIETSTKVNPSALIPSFTQTSAATTPS